jgi:tetratricopeptide (TPR) repeat protein
MFRNFRGTRQSERGLEQKLKSLEQQAQIALPGFDAQFYNRAGDLCVEADDRPRALRYYGEAIDAYLQARRYNAAGAVCRKLLRISPSAVRARCTLAWLSIGKLLLSDARREIGEYVEAAKLAGQERLARKQLVMMADTARDADLRELLAVLLDDLGDSETAAHVRATDPPQMDDDSDAYWSGVLRAALMGPEELGAR